MILLKWPIGGLANDLIKSGKSSKTVDTTHPSWIIGLGEWARSRMPSLADLLMTRFQNPAILLLLGLVTVFAQPRRIAPLGASGKRVALVIGNDNYTALRRLHNAANDAQSVKAELERSGFKVIAITNGTLDDMAAAVDQFIYCDPKR
jgi:hypothetical protein